MRQHASPILIGADDSELVRLTSMSLGQDGHGLSEAYLQNAIQKFPQSLPIQEIDPLFSDPVPICIELSTPAGSIDNVMVTASGLPVLIECKLWKNPEGRREVIGQILDYSKELTRWTASDLQREVSRRTGIKGNAVYKLVREAGHEVEEITFNDAVSYNLRRGRFLLLILGDGIREGVESITDYLQSHTGLHFTLGLIEMPIYEVPGGQMLIAPRVVARTVNIVRTVVETPDGYSVSDDDDDETVANGSKSETPERKAGRERRNAVRQAFWRDYLNGLELDEPEQVKPRPALGGHVVFKFGAPGGSSWLTVYRDMRNDQVGLFLSGNRESVGERASQLIENQRDEIQDELGSEATVDFGQDRPDISQSLTVGDLEDPADRQRAIGWLQERTNTFVNSLRPRIRAALREIEEE